MNKVTITTKNGKKVIAKTKFNPFVKFNQVGYCFILTHREMKRTYLLLIKKHNSDGTDTSNVIININNGEVSFSRSQRYVII